MFSELPIYADCTVSSVASRVGRRSKRRRAVRLPVSPVLVLESRGVHKILATNASRFALFPGAGEL